MPVILHSTKDNAKGVLQGSISPSTLSIVLESGDGALFPQPITSSATSGGTSTTLNSTGIQAAGVVAGDVIRNVTDGSWAVVVSVSTNSATTTRLQGGSGNTWDNSDVWRVREFVVSIETEDGNGNVTAREKVLISDRSTDTLTVPSGGRGFDGSIAQSFDAGDYVRLNVMSATIENLISAIADVKEMANTNQTNIESNDTELVNLRASEPYWLTNVAGTNTITADGTPTLTAYADGNTYRFKAANTISGAATLNIDSVGAKDIKKFTGGLEEDLTAGDIKQNQVVEVTYDSGADSANGAWILTSPLGQAPNGDVTTVGTITAASANVGSSSTADNAMSPTWQGSNSIGANLLSVGSKIMFQFGGEFRLDSGTIQIRVKLGGTTIIMMEVDVTTATVMRPYAITGHIVCRSSGGSGSVIGGAMMVSSILSTTSLSAATSDAGYSAPTAVTVDTTSSLALTVSAKFSASDADHACKLTSGTLELIAAP